MPVNGLPCNPKELYDYLFANGFRNPSLEAKLILSNVLNIDIQAVDESSSIPFSRNQIYVLSGYWDGLQQKQPIQYKLGYTLVSRLKILISNQTLCPGSQVEHVCAAARRIAATESTGTALDLCTGCGVLGVVFAKEHPGWRIFGTDISAPALLIAERNKRLHSLNNLSFHHGDLFEGLAGLQLENGIDLLISNPPYCRTDYIDQRPEQVQRYVPRMALDGGVDGLTFFRAIFAQANRYLRKGAYIILEHEIGRSQDVCNFLSKDYHVIESCEEAIGDNRVLIVRYEGGSAR